MQSVFMVLLLWIIVYKIKLEILLNDSELRNKFGIAGRQNVLEHYNWENNVDLMMDHYKSIL